MGFGLSGTPGLGRSGTRTSDYRERAISANAQNSAPNQAPSNYANREESFGFLLTRSGAAHAVHADRYAGDSAEKPAGFLEFLTRMSCSHVSLRGGWFGSSRAVGVACRATGQRSFGCAIGADVAARASARTAATLSFDGASPPCDRVFGDQQ